MHEPRILDQTGLETLLRRAQMVKAPASLRAKGSNRMLGDLHLRSLEAGVALHLLGAKRRDQIPEAGTEVLLSLLLGDEVLAIHTHLLDPLVAHEGETFFPPVLRAAWPSEGVSFHHRAAIRVAAPDQDPLDALLRNGDRSCLARILNLTETGLGLGFREEGFLREGERIAVEFRLPEGSSLCLSGDVRHIESLTGDPLPFRAGLVLSGNPSESQEALLAFIQQRRMDRSDFFRQGGT